MRSGAGARHLECGGSAPLLDLLDRDAVPKIQSGVQPSLSKNPKAVPSHRTPRILFKGTYTVEFAEQRLTSMGFSTGQWEGRTLVIETTMLTPGWLDGSGYPMSGGNDTRIVERWTPAEDGLTMERIMTIHDKLYTQPLVRTRGSQRGDARVGLIESEPCDARPFLNELLERGELEERLKPE